MKIPYLKLVFFILCINSLQANIDINEITNDIYHEIVEARNKYLSIKNELLSPFNNTNISYDYCLDSLKFLSKNLEIKRREMFLSIKDINLSYDDIYLIDELNNNLIFLHNIINGFGRVYHSYLIHMKQSFSFDQYTVGMEELFHLEMNIPYLSDN